MMVRIPRSCRWLFPVRIPVGALGPNNPTRDECVSPAHPVLASSAGLEMLFVLNEVLVSAKHLVGLNGISHATDIAPPELFPPLFENHQLLPTSGLVRESLQPM